LIPATAALKWKYYIVYCVWLVCESIFLYFCWYLSEFTFSSADPRIDLVETKNHTLEETAAIFDGEGAIARIAGSAAAHANVARNRGVVRSDEKKSKELGEKV
jgi:hypothetical protein